MFTPFHILCNSNRITLWQMVICGIPSFQFKDFLFLLSCLRKNVSLFLCPWRFDLRSPSGFRADLCNGLDKAEQGLMMQASGSTEEIITCNRSHWWAHFDFTGQWLFVAMSHVLITPLPKFLLSRDSVSKSHESNNNNSVVPNLLFSVKDVKLYKQLTHIHHNTYKLKQK